MLNTIQAPVLCYDIEKEVDGLFYQLPQELMDNLFNLLGGRDGNQLKVMIVLLGTKPGFRITLDWILQRTGLTKDAYYKARKALIEKQLLDYDEKQNTLTVLISSISGEYASKIPESISEKYPEVCLENTPVYASSNNITYNIDKKQININKVPHRTVKVKERVSPSLSEIMSMEDE